MKGRLPWIAPAMILLLALSIFPLIYSLQLGLRPAYFERMFHDRLFLIALWQTLLFTALALAAEFVLGLSLALLIDSLGRAARFFRAGLLMPMLLPPVVAAVAWRLIFNPQFGVLNGTLKGFGLRHIAPHLDQRRRRSPAMRRARRHLGMDAVSLPALSAPACNRSPRNRSKPRASTAQAGGRPPATSRSRC